MEVKTKTRGILTTVAALGVVFGDIGTSPLYTFQAALGTLKNPTPSDVVGVVSLIVWALLIIVTLKYVFLVMRADYRGEGGVFALLSLLDGKFKRPPEKRIPLYALFLLFGAALLLGDGTITPAISVLSALEGLETVHPAFSHYVLPVTVLILVLLFAVQRAGTGRLGAVFGWVMLLWFLTLGATGLVWVIREPGILNALNPLNALRVIWTLGPAALVMMGAVVLAVTGVEALYADMGHFGRKAIARAWHGIALPALMLNYMGQGALSMRTPGCQPDNPFFELVPHGSLTVALVVLSTAATVIASQALISGVFTLTVQAQELRFLPKFNVLHTSEKERGQVYVPSMNYILGVICILLVVSFRSSDNLAAAYGLAVTGTMIVTTLAFSLVTVKCWSWPLWKTLLVGGGLLVIELPFLFSCLTKIPQGGYFPLLIAAALMVIMLTWYRGRSIIFRYINSSRNDPEDLMRVLDKPETLKAPGQLTLVSASSKSSFGAARAFEYLQRSGALREQVILMSLIGSLEPVVDVNQTIEVKQFSPHLWHVIAVYGYMQEPRAVEILARAGELSGGKIPAPGKDSYFLLPREIIVEYTGSIMPRWQRSLFGFLSRNVSHGPDYYYIPHGHIVEFTWTMRA